MAKRQKLGRWMEVVTLPRPDDRKTDLFIIRSARSGDTLGEIKWYPRWRQYTFIPYGHTVFNPECLRDITAFIDEQMRQRKEAGP